MEYLEAVNHIFTNRQESRATIESLKGDLDKTNDQVFEECLYQLLSSTSSERMLAALHFMFELGVLVGMKLKEEPNAKNTIN